ncbi:S8 family serine peptidase [Jeotgalibacillus soli]|uniref:S8 family serine peptidase n=1 Tax=Jeotgalibacillus soli TaxID=889306 RepID=UPI000AE58E80
MYNLIAKREVVVKFKCGKSLSDKQFEKLDAEALEESEVADSKVKVLKIGNAEAVVKALK